MTWNSYLIWISSCRISISSQIVRRIGKIDTCSLVRNVNISTINFKITLWKSSYGISSYLNLVQATAVICQVYINTEFFFTINNNLTWVRFIDFCTTINCQISNRWCYCVINCEGNRYFICWTIWISDYNCSCYLSICNSWIFTIFPFISRSCIRCCSFSWQGRLIGNICFWWIISR